MKNFTLGLALLFGGATLLSVACGSDDDGAEATSGSKGGSTSKGGTTGKGGSSSNTGGDTGNGSGGDTTSANGGTDTGAGGNDTGAGGNDTGAGGNDTGAGGGFNNPETCPATAPTDGSECTVVEGGGFENACNYEGSLCFCGGGFGPPGGGGGAGGAGPAGEWNCIDTGGGNNDCPAEQPDEGSECNGTIFGCDYDAVTCSCPGFGPDADTWVCN